MSALSDLLNEARGDLSVREVGRRVAKHGIGESTIIPYFNGRHGTPSVQVLNALAKVLPVGLGQLYTAVGLSAGENEPYEPPIEATMLTRRQRLALDELIRSFVDTRGATHADQPPTPATPPATPARTQCEEDEDQKNRAGDKPADLNPEDQGGRLVAFPTRDDALRRDRDPGSMMLSLSVARAPRHGFASFWSSKSVATADDVR